MVFNLLIGLRFYNLSSVLSGKLSVGYEIGQTGEPTLQAKICKLKFASDHFLILLHQEVKKSYYWQIEVPDEIVLNYIKIKL